MIPFVPLCVLMVLTFSPPLCPRVSASESVSKVWRWGHVGTAPPPIWLHLSCTLPTTDTTDTPFSAKTPHTPDSAKAPVLQLLSLHCCGCPYRYGLPLNQEGKEPLNIRYSSNSNSNSSEAIHGTTG